MATAKRPFTIAFGIFVYGISISIGYHSYKIAQLPPPEPHSHRPQKQANMERVYDDRNRDYDKNIEWDEWLLGIGGLRQNLLSCVKGNVLEVAAGTGRNLEYYVPKNVNHLILSEKSNAMLEKAVIKFRALRQKYGSAKVEFKIIDGHKLPFDDESFDAVVQTFGVCSLHDPVVALKEIKRVTKRDGSILLLEHGRSYYEWLNNILDKTAGSHSQKWGCFWNRDILEIVAQSGLKIEKVDRYHLGTSYIVKCNKK